MTSQKYVELTEPRILGLKEIQQETLDADTVLLEYKLGEQRSYLWAVTRTSIQSFELPGRSEIENAARRVYQLLTARNEHPPGEALSQRQARIAQAEQDYSNAAVELSRILLVPAASPVRTTGV